MYSATFYFNLHGWKKQMTQGKRSPIGGTQKQYSGNMLTSTFLNILKNH